MTDAERDSGAAAGDAGGGDTIIKTGLNRPWLVRVVIMFIVCVGFGTWGLYDAVSVYPARGAGYAEYAEYQYLRLATEARDTGEDRGIFRAERLSVADPEAELGRLSEDETLESLRMDEANETSSRHYRAQMDLAKRDWLIALSRIGMLDAQHTTFGEGTDRPDPAQRFGALQARWTTESPPSPLEVYDIPFQWAIMVVSYALALYLLVLFVRVSSTTYRWKPSDKRLYLPGGNDQRSLVPDDLIELDKRKWDKFIVFVKVADEHPALAGQEIKFDLFRHSRLEDWILEMEAEAFPDEGEEESSDGSGEGGESVEAESGDTQEEAGGGEGEGEAGGEAKA